MRPVCGTFVASTGTLTYDLVSAFARAASSPLLHVMPDGLTCRPASGDHAPWQTRHPFVTAVSCLAGRRRCPKNVRWTCRDRMAAHLADIHIVLELRPSSRLARILVEQHRRSPRAVLILQGAHDGDSPRSGNGEFAERLPVKPLWFHLGKSLREEAGPRTKAAVRTPAVRRDAAPCWAEYLYHYTRVCNGPWPGQNHQRYCISILRGDPLASHSALATLARILNERRIRAGHRRVRGKEPVVSLTSRPPADLHLFRRWNRSQARWTLEPYGIAIRRTILRAMGAKPTIYGDDCVYEKLGPTDRHRFQSRGKRNTWVIEREWRLKGDLYLERLSVEDYFVFVPNAAEAERLSLLARLPGPCVTLE